MFTIEESLLNHKLEDYRQEAARQQLIPKGTTRRRVAALLHRAARAIDMEPTETAFSDGNSPRIRYLG